MNALANSKCAAEATAAADTSPVAMLASHETWLPPSMPPLLPRNTPWLPPSMPSPNPWFPGVASVKVVPGSMVPVGVPVGLGVVAVAGIAPCPGIAAVVVVPGTGVVVDF